MEILRCCVRRCGQPLLPVNGHLRCDNGHQFDQTRQRFYSLVQPQDRKSSRAGDCDAAVDARQRWIASGHCASLIDTLKPLTEHYLRNSLGGVVDLGCGEGSFPHALFADFADRFVGMDLSRRAIKMAARRWPDATWLWANADRPLPIQDDSVDLAMSLFGRRPVPEIARILSPGGGCMVAIPGDDDLIELRQIVQQTGERRSRWEKVSSQFEQQGFRRVSHDRWTDRVIATPTQAADALSMTYRGVRHAEQQRMMVNQPVEVTLSADILVFER